MYLLEELPYETHHSEGTPTMYPGMQASCQVAYLPLIRVAAVRLYPRCQEEHAGRLLLLYCRSNHLLQEGLFMHKTLRRGGLLRSYGVQQMKGLGVTSYSGIDGGVQEEKPDLIYRQPPSRPVAL